MNSPQRAAAPRALAAPGAAAFPAGAELGQRGAAAFGRPSALRASSYRDYLRQWFDWKKSTNQRFSHRVFARLTGLRSPSLLLRIMQGERNLTPHTLPAVCRAMALSPVEAEAFSALVRASWAPLQRGA